MSSFVTGLVRRAAGLPQPVSIRPAAIPAQMPALPSLAQEAPGVHQEVTVTSAAGAGEHRGTDIGRTVFSPHAEPAVLPHPQPAAAPEPVIRRPEQPTAQRENTTQWLRPRSEPAPTPVAASQGQREDRSSSRAADEVRVVPPPAFATVMPAAALGYQDGPASPLLGDTSLKIASGPRPDTVSAPAQPLPRAEFIAASAPASSNRERPPESRSIQVKIGKVEIRSNQPAPVVQPNRPLRTSGFDDLRLARTYLDRSTR